MGLISWESIKEETFSSLAKTKSSPQRKETYLESLSQSRSVHAQVWKQRISQKIYLRVKERSI